MQTTDMRLEAHEREAQKPSLESEIALWVENVSKTFTKTDKKAEKRHRPKTWREKLHWNPHRLRPEKKRVVDSISLYARRGEALGILGPNGCGKSTLVRMISTLLIPDEGRVEVFGLDVVKESMAVKRLINRVSVDAAFFKKLSAMENLLYTARLYGIEQEPGMEKAREILRLLGFDAENLDNSMEQLSRGQQQKVAIARAFLTSPRLVLLDEPTTGLDPKSKKDVAAFINRLRAEQDVTLLLTTHDMAEAEALCDRIAILNRGKLVALGTAEELKANARKSPEDPLPTLEEVFIALAGEKLEDADEKEDEDDGPASPLLAES
ncbi:MAG TPA: ABC transporter ATP-binding protein [Chthonomonadaceae bacterium]|nr:ABC transporter ATP-binding protein [Chthonomonadaceae bacterium]